jgi:hypothetical protein
LFLLKKLSLLHVWNTALTDSGMAALKKSMGAAVFEKVLNGDTTILALTAPVLLTRITQ